MAQRTRFPTTFIYALVDPRTNECRYVGKANDIQNRFKNHLEESKVENRHVHCWIRSLMAENIRPETIQLDEVYEHAWSEEEIWWVAYMKSLGANLTNHGPGGEGVLMTPEVRYKCGNGNRGKNITQEHKDKVSKGNKGRIKSPEECARISAGKLGRTRQGHPCSEETKEKIRLKMTGRKLTDEAVREKISVSSKGRTWSLTDEQKEKHRIISLGYKHTPEALEKIRIAGLRPNKGQFGIRGVV